MLVVKYNRKNFFGDEEYCEDKKENFSLPDLKKAFLFLKRNYSATIEIDNIVLSWDSIQNFEHGVLTGREYESWNNYKEYLWNYDSCKKNYYQKYKE